MHRELVQSQILAAYLADRAEHYGRETVLNVITLFALFSLIAGVVAFGAGVAG